MQFHDPGFSGTNYLSHSPTVFESGQSEHLNVHYNTSYYYSYYYYYYYAIVIATGDLVRNGVNMYDAPLDNVKTFLPHPPPQTPLPHCSEAKGDCDMGLGIFVTSASFLCYFLIRGVPH